MQNWLCLLCLLFSPKVYNLGMNNAKLWCILFMVWLLARCVVRRIFSVSLCNNFIGKMVVPLGWYPSCSTPQGAPLKGDISDIPNRYPLYEVYMGLIMKDTIPRVPPFSLWQLFKITYITPASRRRLDLDVISWNVLVDGMAKTSMDADIWQMLGLDNQRKKRRGSFLHLPLLLVGGNQHQLWHGVYLFGIHPYSPISHLTEFRNVLSLPSSEGSSTRIIAPQEGPLHERTRKQHCFSKTVVNSKGMFQRIITKPFRAVKDLTSCSLQNFW